MVKNFVRTLLGYFRAPPKIHSANADAEIREEIEFHLASSVIDKMQTGLSVEDSRQEALERFGDVDSVIDSCRQVVNTRQVLLHRAHIALTMILAIAVCSMAYRLLIQQYDVRATSNSSRGAVELNSIVATGYSSESTHGDITGSVTGELQESVGNAHVLAVVKSWPPNGYRQQSYMTTTRADGTFRIDDVYAPDFEYEVQVAVLAEGRLLSSHYQNLTKGLLDPIQFQLKQTKPFELKFESGDGIPIEGVAAFPCKRIDQQGKKHQVYFSSADPIVQKSDDTGRVSMPHFLPGEKAAVYVRFPDSDWQMRDLVVPRSDSLVVLKASRSGL